MDGKHIQKQEGKHKQGKESKLIQNKNMANRYSERMTFWYKLKIGDL